MEWFVYSCVPSSVSEVARVNVPDSDVAFDKDMMENKVNNNQDKKMIAAKPLL